MSSYDDTLLAARFAALAPEPLPGDWSDVLGRAGMARKGRGRLGPSRVTQGSRRRRLLVLAAATLVLALATASAYGVRALFVGTGLVGLPPVGAPPSTPKKGELVLSFTFAHSFGDPGRFHVAVYADGRLITERVGEHGILERRLTPEGVELVRAEVISTGLVDDDLHLTSGPGLYFGGHIEFRAADRVVHVTWGNGTWRGVPGPDVIKDSPTPEQAGALRRLDARLADLASWLPTSAWRDPQTRAFVPSSYSVCYEGTKGVGLSGVLALLPAAAGDLLRVQENKPMPYTNLAGTFLLWCSELTTAEARKLEQILDGAGVRGWKDVFGLTYGAPGPGQDATEFSLSFNPNLPDEE
jgi:hypothetical protein